MGWIAADAGRVGNRGEGEAAPRRGRPLWPALLIGAGLAGTLDEVVLHQLLHWHHFDDRAGREAGLVSDGLFHLASTGLLVPGVAAAVGHPWRDVMDGRRSTPGGDPRRLWGGVLVGLGAFDLFDATIQHKVLRLHQVRPAAESWLPYDIGFGGLAVAALVAGLLLPRVARGVRGEAGPVAGVEARTTLKVHPGTGLAGLRRWDNADRPNERRLGAMADDKNQNTIADYVGDMVALESHIEEALDRQLNMSDQHPEAAAAIQRFHDMVKGNRDALKAHQEQTGTTAGNPIIAAGSAALGVAAGLIDKIRAEGVSKALRDDYTAFNHACIGYTMLHVTALALGDQATATLAERGLRGHASAVQEINHIMADVVVWELQKDDHQLANPNAAAENRRTVDQVWKQTDKSGMTQAMNS